MCVPPLPGSQAISTSISSGIVLLVTGIHMTHDVIAWALPDNQQPSDLIMYSRRSKRRALPATAYIRSYMYSCIFKTVVVLLTTSCLTPVELCMGFRWRRRPSILIYIYHLLSLVVVSSKIYGVSLHWWWVGFIRHFC